MAQFALDGRACSAPEGATVLQACRDAGVWIPTLCHLDGLSAAASCRLCLVEVRGLPHAVPACATKVEPGMEIVTSSDALRQYRRAVVEMLFAGGDHVCGVCHANGQCELQELARAVGLDHVALGVARRARPIDASHPIFALDPGRCVLCTRCVRACAEVEHAASLAIAGRARRTQVITDGLGAWASSPTCTGCGKCVDACPTGALFEKERAAQGLPRRGHVLGARVSRQVAVRPGLGGPGARRARLATVQLGGCAGCHMSLLDADDALLELAASTDLVFSPFADAPEFPEHVDVCLVEGAVATSLDLALVHSVRARSRFVVALGDCAGWGNVTAMRDAIGGARRVMPPDSAQRTAGLAELLERVRPLHEVVRVDAHVPGCPPPADLILGSTTELLAGRMPQPARAGRFG